MPTSSRRPSGGVNACRTMGSDEKREQKETGTKRRSIQKKQLFCCFSCLSSRVRARTIAMSDEIHSAPQMEGGTVPDDDEETIYYPDFYDPAMLCVFPLFFALPPRSFYHTSHNSQKKKKRQKLPATMGRQNIIGHVPGVKVGKIWKFRSQCSKDLVHRPWVAGKRHGSRG